MVTVEKKKKINILTNTFVVVVIGISIALMLYFGIIDEYNGQLLVLAGIYIIVALSLNLITGFTGQLALGHAGFMAVGAYTSAICMLHFDFPLIITIFLGGSMTAVIGFLIGFPVLRLRGDYLAIATLGFGEIIRVVINSLDKLTGGPTGLKGIPSFVDADEAYAALESVFGGSIPGFMDKGVFALESLIKFIWVYVFVVIVILGISNLIKSTKGRAVISIREDEIAASSMGIDVWKTKMFSFTLSSFIAGVGGALYASYFGYLNPTMFSFMNSVNFIVIVVLGGLGSVTGTVIASVFFVYLQEWLRVFKDLRLVIFGFMLVLVMIFWPSGLMGNKEFSLTGFKLRLRAGYYKPSNIVNRIKSGFKPAGRRG